MPNHIRISATSKRSFLNGVKKRPILASIFCIAIVVAVSTLANKYYEQQKTLNELSAVSKDLRVIYDKLLASQEGNIASSYFRNECSTGNASWLVRYISCGPTGRVTLKNNGDRRIAANAIADGPYKENDFSIKYISESISMPDSGTDDMYVDLEHNSAILPCYVIYGKNVSNSNWGYTIGCSMTVPDFLPDYVVKE